MDNPVPQVSEPPSRAGAKNFGEPRKSYVALRCERMNSTERQQKLQQVSTIVFVTCLLIALARITDFSLGTLRMVAVIQGRRALATVLGFLEAVVLRADGSWSFQQGRI